MRSESRGFTLLEMMVSLILVSAIMLGLLSAMRTLGASVERIEAVADRISTMDAVNGFLRTSIRGMVDASVRAGSGGSGFEPAFKGEKKRLRWVGVMSARHEIGGLHMFELELIERGGVGALLLHYAPYSGPSAELQSSARNQHVLLDGVEELQFAYQGNAENNDWANDWQGAIRSPNQLPARIRLSLRVQGRYWPEIIIPVSGL